MIPTTFQDFLAIAFTNSYLLIFIIMILEGPTITTAASFAASLGYFNIWIIFVLSLLGDLIGDGLHYAVGYFGRKKIVEKYDHIFKINGKIMKKIEKHYHKHMGKTLFFVKMTPLATPGLLLAGASRLPLKKYIAYSFIITLPRTIFFTSLGFLFGSAIEKTLHYFQLSSLLLLGLIILTEIIYFFNKYTSNKLMKILKNEK